MGTIRTIFIKAYSIGVFIILVGTNTLRNRGRIRVTHPISNVLPYSLMYFVSHVKRVYRSTSSTLSLDNLMFVFTIALTINKHVNEFTKRRSKGPRLLKQIPLRGLQAQHASIDVNHPHFKHIYHGNYTRLLP